MIVWIIALAIITGIAVALATVALPRIFLKMKYGVEKTNDRCIKSVQEKNGQSLVFETEERWRKYVDQYVLADRRGKKEFCCRVSKELRYIELDVAIFDNQNKVKSVIRVKEFVDGKGIIEPVELPDETSYVSVNVVRADYERFKDRVSAKLPKGKLVKFLLLNALVVLMEVIGIKICLANMIGGIFRQSFILNGTSLLISLGVAVVLIGVNTLCAAISVKARENRFTVKGKKDA